MNACVLDTDVVIAALDRSDAHHARATRALAAMIESKVELVMSTVNYAEALVRPAEQDGALDRAVEAIRALGVRLVAPSSSIALDAARLRGRGVSLPDGFALATARSQRASIASFDRRVRRTIRPAGLQLAAELD